MATRKSEDGSRSADAGSESPGSYVKVSGSRRRRKRRGSTMPPPRESAASDAPRIVDTVGESEDDEPSAESGIVVDDLRRGSKPSSNRPRKEIGPLGIDDIRSQPPANSVGVEARGPSAREQISDRPRTLNVVEINASEAPRPDPFGEEVITTLSPVSQLFGDEDEDADVSDSDRELAREYALDDLRAPEQDERVSLQSVRDVLERRDSYEAIDNRHSMSSVLGARPSLRPSSPMPEKPRDGASVLWWLVVAALVGIIAAAGAIAAREQFADEAEPAAPVAAPEPAPSAPVVEVVKRPAVSFGTPQTAEAIKVKVEPAASENDAPRTPASPSPPNVVPPAQSAAVRAGAPYTSAVTGAASANKPNTVAPGASAVKPTERKAKPVKPAEPSYAPGYGKPLEATGFAPGYNPPANVEPAPESTPAKPAETEALPINPYE
jgi:hypothetical protein